jgi:hypothetical protein
MTTTWTYGCASIKDLQCQAQTRKDGRSDVTAVMVNDQPCRPTDRFWNSLTARFGFSKNIFRYFTPVEVFNRVSEVAPNDQVRYCVEQEDGDARLLAVTNPGAPVIKHDDLMELLTQYQGEQIRYSDGVVRSTHAPRLSGDFTIAGDAFSNRFIIDTPVDGYGRPNIYLSLLRQICTNGAVGYAPAFRSEIGLGRGNERPTFALVRALEGFNNEDGFAALRQRFESAATSWASVNEVQRLYKTLVRLQNQGALTGAPVQASGSDGAEALPEPAQRSAILRAYQQLTGDLTELYGLANLDVLSVRRQQTLPTKAKVYDLLNFASETATHHATAAGNRDLQAFIGGLISTDFDLEGLADQHADFRDFFIGNEQTAETLVEMQRA